MIFIFLKNPESLVAAVCEWCFTSQVFPLIQLLPRAAAPQRVPPQSIRRTWTYACATLRN